MGKNILRFVGISFAQALSASVFVWLWSMFMLNINQFVDESEAMNTTGFILIPIMFIIVAVLAAGSVLGYPIYLAVKDQWGRAIGLVSLTLIWLGILAIILVYVF